MHGHLKVKFDICKNYVIKVSELIKPILIIKTTRCTNFSNLFWNKSVHVSDSSFVHRQEFFIVHTAMVYVIQVC